MTTWEGGHREAFLAIWPGKVAAFRTSAALASSMDILPMLAKLANVELPRDRVFDGLDLGQVLFEGADELHEWLVHPTVPTGKLETVRWHQYKAHYSTGGHADCNKTTPPIVQHKVPLIFDLDKDPAESTPLTPSDADYATALQKLNQTLHAVRLDIAADNTTKANYALDLAKTRKVGVNCCNPDNLVCRCHYE